ncbi:microfibril-associated glycoprotein 4-like [Mizuhopecten yessoensis]|uniref:microfibril-associated glycoprotein 4-like n=1 Tax=Mizuhopecten yessoensis TaxID=6573 RepID=UPI000B457F7B|nr:microfibril-associated glycoprotein 4-like [Mizuhopecten yessoensis]
MNVTKLNHCLFYFLLVCNLENGISESGCSNKQNKELLSRLSSKLTYIAAEIQETYSLLKNMSISGLQRDYLALLKTGSTQSGVYNVSVTGTDTTSVWCDMETDGGGWTVFQRRIDGATDFYKGWEEYRNGFGDVNHEFWLGNDKLHALTSADNTELRVDIEDFENNTAYAQYQQFAIWNIMVNYRLNISGYSGNAGDSLKRHNGYPFSTIDKDKDNIIGNCAVLYHGAWWYEKCHVSNLNGLYLSGRTSIYAKGITWHSWKGYYYSLKSTKMMIRRLTKT